MADDAAAELSMRALEAHRVSELEALLAEKEGLLVQAAAYGRELLLLNQHLQQQLVGPDRVSALSSPRVDEELMARVRSLQDQLQVAERSNEQLLRDLTVERSRSVDQGTHEAERTKLQKREEELLAELAENDGEISMLQKENERLNRLVRAAAIERQQQQQQQQSVSAVASSAGSAATPSFLAVTKEQLRAELLVAAEANEASERKNADLQENIDRLERTVQQLFRLNNDLTDQLEAATTGGNNNNNTSVDMNASLADELSLSEPPTPEKVAAVAPAAAAAAAAAVPAAAAATVPAASKDRPAPSDGAKSKQTNDRQYREYVYMTVSAIKIAMAVKEVAPSEVLLKLSAKRVYERAVERKVPLHQVHDFVRKYAVAYVERASAPKEPVKAPPLGLLGRVMTTYFPSTDYLFRTSEVVPNRGSELGSFLHKRGTLLSRGWKQRWFKLNTQLGVVSYHPSPHVLNSLGTINLDDISAVTSLPPSPPFDFVFRIVLRFGREFDVAAESATVKKLWMDALIEAMAQAQTLTADKRQSREMVL